MLRDAVSTVVAPLSACVDSGGSVDVLAWRLRVRRLRLTFLGGVPGLGSCLRTPPPAASPAARLPRGSRSTAARAQRSARPAAHAHPAPPQQPTARQTTDAAAEAKSRGATYRAVSTRLAPPRSGIAHAVRTASRGWAVLRAVGLIGIGRAWELGLPGGKQTWGPAGRAALDRVLASG